MKNAGRRVYFGKLGKCKIIKNGLRVLEREENLLQNGMLQIVIKLSPSSEIVLQSLRKSDFSERSLTLEGLREMDSSARKMEMFSILLHIKITREY